MSKSVLGVERRRNSSRISAIRQSLIMHSVELTRTKVEAGENAEVEATETAKIDAVNFILLVDARCDVSEGNCEQLLIG